MSHEPVYVQEEEEEEEEECHAIQHLGLPTFRIAYYIVLSARPNPCPRNETLRDAYKSVDYAHHHKHIISPELLRKKGEKKRRTIIVTIVKVLSDCAIYSYNQRSERI